MIQYQKPKLMYKGNRVDVLSVEADHPNGKKIRREVVDHPGAVVIVPLLDDQTVILIRNYRHVVMQTLWELPAGTLEKDEEPLACAGRELEEETGYKAAHLTHLFDMYSTPGFCNEFLHVYLAKELSFVGQNLDETEQIEIEPLKLTKALAMIKEGVICDAKTIAALFYLEHTGSQ